MDTVLKAIAPIVAGSDADNLPERLDAMALIGETHSIRENPSTRLNASKNWLRARLRHQIRIFGDDRHMDGLAASLTAPIHGAYWFYAKV